MDKSQLTDKDLYCIAKMLQGFMLKNRTYDCGFCEYVEQCFESELHFEVIRDKLEQITGLTLEYFRDDE